MAETRFDMQKQDYDSLLDMFRTVSNTTGDIAVTLIVAKMEKLLDIDVYKS